MNAQSDTALNVQVEVLHSCSSSNPFYFKVAAAAVNHSSLHFQVPVYLQRGTRPLRQNSPKQRPATSSVKMLTKYITSVSASFSPFNARSGKTARNFLAMLPPNARTTMAISIKMLGKEGAQTPASLALKFSM